jgi:hypothetical protein
VFVCARVGQVGMGMDCAGESEQSVCVWWEWERAMWWERLSKWEWEWVV